MARPTIHAEIVAAKMVEKAAFWRWQEAVSNKRAASLFDDEEEEAAYLEWYAANEAHDRLIDEMLGDRRRLLIENGN